LLTTFAQLEQQDLPLVNTTHPISVKGHIRHVPAIRLDDAVVVVGGTAVRVGEIFDAYWLEAARLPDPRHVVDQLRRVEGRPDLFTFTQRVPETRPTFDFHLEWDNVAAIPVSSYEHWFQKQVSSATRRNIRASEKKGVVVRISPFDEEYIRGIMSISDESPVRAGRRYWHYGKDFATVEAEQGTYRERSTYLGAYLGDEMIGYMKIVWDARSAAIMQIVSKLKFLDRRPNNALLAAGVKLCAERGVEHLLYERFVYGKKEDSSLTRFKRENGFVRVDLPCYYVPLTTKGRIVLGLGLHKSIKDRLPMWLTKRLLEARDKWYSRRWPQDTRTEAVSSSS
jgi:hypothetical protein